MVRFLMDATQLFVPYAMPLYVHADAKLGDFRFSADDSTVLAGTVFVSPV